MAGTTLVKDTIICEYGHPVTALQLITSGKVTVSYPGGTYLLGKGDVIGICEVWSEVHFLDYTVSEEATVLTYPCENPAVLDDFLKKQPDIARLFILSAFTQVNTLLEHCATFELNCNSYHQHLLDDYETYTLLCKRYRIEPRTLNNFEDLSAYLGEEAPDLWLSDYYLGLSHLYSGEHSKHLLQESCVSSGLLRKCSLDFHKAYTVLEEQFRYLQQICSYYFNISGNDLFDFYTALYYKLGQGFPETNDILNSINRIVSDFRDNSDVDSTVLNQRIRAFEQNIVRLQSADTDSTGTEGEAIALGELAGSLSIILEYAKSNSEIADSFRQHVNAYKLLSDKFSTEEEACRLRAELTKEFYLLYSFVFRRTLEGSAIPAPVKMFLYFGYVDEELAGISNAVHLYNLLGSLTDRSSHGVYTFYDWLLAIYEGRKEPSRNEFDQDYSDYIHKQRASGNITDKELKDLENDNIAKVNYELNNLFPSANKITYGRISVFCPLFCADNVLKNLDDSHVTVSMVANALEHIRKYDYSVFYRESLDKDNMNILGKEMLHFEYLPDIILMPNVGIRGVMWQEIEGKRRNSPGRMFFSMFHLEDFTLTMTRLAGEFRWELCKRIQGSRWNDVGELSLTSEYFDYIQFYRKNQELSNEAKERVRSGLQRAKNSFKEMFVRDYIVWIMFEGNGSPRLNRVARKILFTYCPFPQNICEGLKQNPLYTDILKQHELQKAQKLHRLNKLVKKLRNSGTPVPDSLERELLYVEGTISS